MGCESLTATLTTTQQCQPYHQHQPVQLNPCFQTLLCTWAGLAKRLSTQVGIKLSNPLSCGAESQLWSRQIREPHSWADLLCFLLCSHYSNLHWTKCRSPHKGSQTEPEMVTHVKVYQLCNQGNETVLMFSISKPSCFYFLDVLLFWEVAQSITFLKTKSQYFP